MYPNHKVIMGGDINCDLRTDGLTSRKLKTFMADVKLTLCNDVLTPNCDYTYFHEGLNFFSYINFFMISTKDIVEFTQLKMLDQMVYLSDHLPIDLSGKCINKKFLTHSKQPKESVQQENLQLRWDKADLTKY